MSRADRSDGRRLRGERGITLAEVMFTSLLLSVVSIIAFQGLIGSSRMIGGVDDEARGLQDLKVVVERLSRDLREARSVTTGSTASRLTIWIDASGDYVQTAEETITWRLEVSDRPNQFDVIREDGNGEGSVQGTTLVSQLAFTYLPNPPPATNTVRVSMTYDALPGTYQGQRTNEFEVRMRNVQ